MEISEDIKILKECVEYQTFGRSVRSRTSKLDTKCFTALENILHRFEELKKENAELKSKKYLMSISCDRECQVCEHFKNEYLLEQELEPIHELNIPVETLVAEFKRLENIEDGREQLKQINKGLKEMLKNKIKYTQELEQDLFENCSNYVVPKAKIKEKIEELNNQYREYNEKWENSGMNKEHPFYKYLIRIEAEVDILEELLGEE